MTWFRRVARSKARPCCVCWMRGLPSWSTSTPTWSCSRRCRHSGPRSRSRPTGWLRGRARRRAWPPPPTRAPSGCSTWASSPSPPPPAAARSRCGGRGGSNAASTTRRPGCSSTSATATTCRRCSPRPRCCATPVATSPPGTWTSASCPSTRTAACWPKACRCASCTSANTAGWASVASRATPPPTGWRWSFGPGTGGRCAPRPHAPERPPPGAGPPTPPAGRSHPPPEPRGGTGRRCGSGSTTRSTSAPAALATGGRGGPGAGEAG